MPDDDIDDVIMSFTVCASQGGPYDDASFAAGFQLGQIYVDLENCAETGSDPEPGVTVPTRLVPQLDLVAMRHGMTMTVEPCVGAPEESLVTFAFPDPGDADVVPRV